MKKSNLLDETLTKKEVDLIVASINHSKVQYEDWNNERKLGFSNGKYLDRWNYIFANIRNSFNYESFKTYSYDRGILWRFAVIYNSNTNILYLLLKEGNFKRIRDNAKTQNHYLRIFNSINSGYKIAKDTQISFLGNDISTIPNKQIDKDLENLLSEIKGKVRICKNILFTENANGVVKVTENVANYNLDIIRSFDLTKHVVADIETISDTKDDIIELFPEIELKIRKDKMKDNKDDIIKDKDNKDKESEKDLDKQ